MPQTDYTGLAKATQLVGTLSAASGPGTVIALLNGTGFPTGATGINFVICLDKDTSSEEKILCSLRSGNNVTIAQRAYDDTVAVTHTAGTVHHTVDATVLRTTSAHVFDVTRDDHTQYMRIDGVRSATGLMTIARPSDGASLLISRAATSMQAGSIFINRDATTKPISITFAGAIAYSMSIGLSASSDNMEIGSYNGSNYNKQFQFTPTGAFAALGSSSTLGAGVFGGAQAFTTIGDNGFGAALISAGHGTLANANLDLRPKGTGVVIVEKGDGSEAVRFDAVRGVRIGGSVSQPSTGSQFVHIAMANIGTAITDTPTSGGWLYVNGGTLQYKGSSGTVTTIAPA